MMSVGVSATNSKELIPAFSLITFCPRTHFFSVNYLCLSCALVDAQVLTDLEASNFRRYFLDTAHYDEKPADFVENLYQFSTKFTGDVKLMIRRGLARLHSGRFRDILTEASHHARICSKYLRNFHGQRDLLNKVENFLKDPARNSRAFVVHGSAGSGKSAVMARIARSAREWTVDGSVVLLRFLGTSSSSSSVHEAVVSITEQICGAYDVDFPDTSVTMKTLFDALTTFREVLRLVSERFAAAQPLVMVLDGIDELMPMEDSMRALWAIRHMPSNVHLILSTVTEMAGRNVAEMLASVVTTGDCVAPVEPLTEADVISIVNTEAGSGGEKLEDDVRAKTLETASEHLDPLFVRLIVNDRLENMDLDGNGGSPRDASEFFAAKLQQLESKFGAALIKHVASYLTTNVLGIHERELLDVLNSHPGLVESRNNGISSFLWVQVRSHLRPFLRENLVCGQVVVSWNHRLWSAVTAQRYGVIYPGVCEDLVDAESTALTVELHENLVRLFLGESSESASVMPQPTNHHNRTKLMKLPLHLQVLLPVEGLKRAKAAMFFDFDWLMAKVTAYSVQSVLTDIQAATELTKLLGDNPGDMDKDVSDLQVMYEFLQLAEDRLQLQPDRLTLASEILARLTGVVDRYPTFGALVESAQLHMGSCDEVPPTLTVPELPLRHSLRGPSHLVDFSRDQVSMLLFTTGSSADLYKIETGERLHSFPAEAKRDPDGILLTHSGDYVLISSFSPDDHVTRLNVHSVATGIPVVRAEFLHNFELLAFDHKDEILFVSTCVKVGADEDLQKCLLGIEIRTQEVVCTFPVSGCGVHADGISRMVFTADDRHVITAGNENSRDVACWNLETQDLKWKVTLDEFAQHMKGAHDRLVLLSPNSGVLTVIDIQSGDSVISMSEESTTGAQDVYVFRDGGRALLASARYLSVLDLETGAVCQKVSLSNFGKDSSDLVTRITMDSRELCVCVGYSSGAIDVVSILDGRLVARFEQHCGSITSLARTESHRWVVSTSEDGLCCVWNLNPTIDRYFQQRET